MPFSKQAFTRRDHRTITVYIMGERFDSILFDAVHRYIDRMGGTGHREKHGHNQPAEEYIRQNWGELGVEMFRIHVLSDRLHDKLGSAVLNLYNRLMAGELEMPYYAAELKNELEPSKIAAKTLELQCSNCGSADDLELLATWYRGPICIRCLNVRNLDVCVQCRALFPKMDRVESPDNPGYYLCPVCVAGPS